MVFPENTATFCSFELPKLVFIISLISFRCFPGRRSEKRESVQERIMQMLYVKLNRET